MSKRNFSKSISGKGYYIALVLCAVAIGVSGYLYYRNVNTPEPQLQDPGVQAGQSGEDVQAVATQPDSTAPSATDPTEGEQQPAKPAKTAAPVEGQTVAAYAMETLSYNQTTRDWRVHDGIDIAAQAGTQVRAAADGTVYTVYEDDVMGMTVVIRHDGGYTTKYASLAEAVSVKAGDAVQVGQVIGTVGNTALLESAIGEHVHFSVACNDVPVDPADFLK